MKTSAPEILKQKKTKLGKKYVKSLKDTKSLGSLSTRRNKKDPVNNIKKKINAKLVRPSDNNFENVEDNHKPTIPRKKKYSKAAINAPRLPSDVGKAISRSLLDEEIMQHYDLAVATSAAATHSALLNPVLLPLTPHLWYWDSEAQSQARTKLAELGLQSVNKYLKPQKTYINSINTFKEETNDCSKYNKATQCDSKRASDLTDKIISSIENQNSSYEKQLERASAMHPVVYTGANLGGFVTFDSDLQKYSRFSKQVDSVISKAKYYFDNKSTEALIKSLLTNRINKTSKN